MLKASNSNGGMMAPSGNQFIKGLTFKSRVTFLEKTYGPEALTRLIPHLEGEVKGLIANPRSIKATAWYPLEDQVRLDKTICKYLANGDETIYRKMGAFSAEFHDSHIQVKQYKDPWRFINLHSTIYPRFFKPARVEILRPSSHEARIRIFEFRSVKENCETNIGFFFRNLELCGAEEVEVVETQCTRDPGVEFCEYKVRWR